MPPLFSADISFYKHMKLALRFALMRVLTLFSRHKIWCIKLKYFSIFYLVVYNRISFIFATIHYSQ